MAFTSRGARLKARHQAAHGQVPGGHIVLATRNPVAASLASPHLKAQTVPNKRRYSRTVERLHASWARAEAKAEASRNDDA